MTPHETAIQTVAHAALNALWVTVLLSITLGLACVALSAWLGRR